MYALITGVVVGAIFFGASAPAFAQTIVLRYAGTLPVSHHISKGQEMFAHLVGEKTGGKVKVENYPAGQLYKAHDIPTAVVSGAVDIGDNLTNVWTKDAISEINDVPFLFRDARHAGKAWDTEGQLFKAYSAKMATRHMKPLGISFFGSLFDFALRAHPLKEPSDLKGLKVRSYGALASESLRTLGASPVTMDPGEMYLALQSGTIDGAITGVTSIDQRKLWEASKYATIANVTYGVFAVNMGLRKFNRLPPDVQKALQEAGREVFLWSVDEAARQDAKSKDFISEKLEVTELTPAQKAEWARILTPVVEDWMKRADGNEKALVSWIRSL
jgi:TRAP-type C4-dicarboxylate transport system substrate-binding protein